MSALVAVSMIVWLAPATATAAPKSLLVPSAAYPTIQSAVEAARSGDRIKVLPGTYREQVSIAKSLTITGSGPGVTTIAAPETLVAGADGNNSIVEIRNGASVAMSLIGVSGPGAATCDNPLEAGIRVLEGAHLDLRFARVTHIRNSPTVACFRQGVGVLVGIITDPASGTAVIRDSLISDYATKGILILSAGPATITQNVITGPARLPADGIDALFSASKISFNFITGNVCPAGSTSCANDPLTGVQKFAILIGGVPGGVVTYNVASGNQVGIFGLGGDVALNHNALLNNSDFGYELADGSFVVSDDRIVGGIGGVAVLAVGADADVRLIREQIVGTSGPPVLTEQCCGFTATASRQP
jgi:Right handed beta helix region